MTDKELFITLIRKAEALAAEGKEPEAVVMLDAAITAMEADHMRRRSPIHINGDPRSVVTSQTFRDNIAVQVRNDDLKLRALGA